MMMMTEKIAEIEDEYDWYDAHLARIGRSPELDWRIVVHESSHALAARLLGLPVGGMTCDPGEGFGGRVWGPERSVAFRRDGDVTDHGIDAVPALCDQLCDVMPKDGEPRDDVAGIYLHAQNRCIELVAASVGERMLLEGEPALSVTDVEHSIKYASLVCRSSATAESFIRMCEAMAEDLLRPYGFVLIVLATALKIRRTLDGQTIDKIISETVAGIELAAERARRRQWQASIDNAKTFAAQRLAVAKVNQE